MTRASEGANDMHPLILGGGGAQTEKIQNIIVEILNECSGISIWAHKTGEGDKRKRFQSCFS